MSAPVFGGLPDDAELRKLVAACCNGAGTPEDWRQLDRLIVACPQVAEFYFSHVAMCAHLRHVLGESADGDATRVEDALMLPTIQIEREPPRRRHARKRLWWLSGSIAAVLMVALSIVVYRADFFGSRAVVGPPVVAWIEAATPDGTPRKLLPGDRVRQEMGQTRLQFKNGVQLSLSGDVDLEMISPMSVRLHSGQLQADVGKKGRGFRVLTDSTDVVDLGTVFGVGVNPTGETDVVVFEGEVELSRGNDRAQGRAAQRYTTGEAVRVESGGEKTRISTIWQRSAGSRWSTAAGRDAGSLISSVGDNLSTESRPKFYSIVPGGFREGARAYVDRTHTWSGLGEESLPEMLVGGDYIQTFNDDKVESEIEISMTVSRPSRIYLLVDSRMRIPDWLERDFTNTGHRLAMSSALALDERRSPEELSRVSSSHGTRYVDGRWEFVFSVWEHDRQAAGEIRLGPCNTRAAIYGIVVVPAELGR